MFLFQKEFSLASVERKTNCSFSVDPFSDRKIFPSSNSLIDSKPWLKLYKKFWRTDGKSEVLKVSVSEDKGLTIFRALLSKFFRTDLSKKLKFITSENPSFDKVVRIFFLIFRKFWKLVFGNCVIGIFGEANGILSIPLILATSSIKSWSNFKSDL